MLSGVSSEVPGGWVASPPGRERHCGLSPALGTSHRLLHFWEGCWHPNHIFSCLSFILTSSKQFVLPSCELDRGSPLFSFCLSLPKAAPLASCWHCSPRAGEGHGPVPLAHRAACLCAATAVALPRQTMLVIVVIFLSACTPHSSLILMAISLNFPQIFQSSSVNNMARTKTNPSDGVFPWPVPVESAPCCLCPSAMQWWGDKARIHIPLTLTTVAQSTPAPPFYPIVSRSLHF